MKRDLLVTLADENYVEPAKALFSSAYFNGRWAGDFLLLACDIPETKLAWFVQRGIRIQPCRPLYSEGEWSTRILDQPYATRHPLPPSVSAKIRLFGPQFKEWRTVVYLDGDTLVRDPLAPLLQVKGFRAAVDGTHTLLEQFPRLSRPAVIRKLGGLYDLRRRSFNAGVFSFSTDLLTPQTFDLVKQLFDELLLFCAYADQPVLNLFFFDRWEKLPLTFNCGVPAFARAREGSFKEIGSCGSILHFHGPEKPWFPRSPFYPEWKSNRDRAEQMDASQSPPDSAVSSRRNPQVCYCRLKDFLFRFREKIRGVLK